MVGVGELSRADELLNDLLNRTQCMGLRLQVLATFQCDCFARGVLRIPVLQMLPSMPSPPN